MGQAMITRRGGGSAIHFKVVAVSGAGSLPATAKAQTIALVTSLSIGNVTFASAQPANPAEGDVWMDISRNAQIPLTVSSKPGILIYPVRCQQYAGGAWTLKRAFTYSGSAWVEWYSWLYLEGDERVETGGAWVLDYVGGGSVTKSPDGMVLCQPSSSITSVRKTTPVNVSAKQYLKITLTCLSGTGSVKFGLQSTTGSTVPPNIAAVVSDAWTAGQTRTLTVDVNTVSGSYYPILQLWLTGTYRITRIWLEN